MRCVLVGVLGLLCEALMPVAHAAPQAAREKHWAFVPPTRPAVPAVKDELKAKKSVRNPIDAIVLKRFQREGLEPSPQAKRTILLRRDKLDPTGLPPTP